MSTAAQIAANQHNAPLSKGAMSQDGRNKVRLNALSHGLTSKQVVLPTEDPAEFDELRTNMMRDYDPQGAGELTLLTEVIEHYWRMQRAKRQETALWDVVMADQLQKVGKPEFDDEFTCDEAMARAFCDRGKDFDRLRRYATTIERSYYKALNALFRAQKERHRLEQQKVRNELAAKRAETAALRAANAAARLRPRTPSQIGTVSQSRHIAEAPVLPINAPVSQNGTKPAQIS